MTMQARTFPDYAAGLKMAYEEEIGGETFFAAMAEVFDGIPAEALTLMARMEAETVRVLTPAVERAGIAIADRDRLRAEGRAEGIALARRGWPDIARMMAEEYGAYVEEFAWTFQAAPEAERDRLQFLIDHEVAIIDFARAWRRGDADCLRPLRDYLALTAAH